ncbi:hypothetical protein OWV82_021318 [Melia azedarach]|uniref:Uncharacterized protein n=1 Tax=Melia azedarach TaxID=155640 RepID=A0ACC1X2G6_MELAZ|nr:hypothetical protein OWV82_021318 [Melia azedarach]
MFEVIASIFPESESGIFDGQEEGSTRTSRRADEIEHLGVKGYQHEEMDRNGGASQPKKEHPGTEGRNEMGRIRPAGEPAVDEGIDVDEYTG